MIFDRLDTRIKNVLTAHEITEPTEAQRLAIPLILAGENVLLIAPTGIGKTEAAALPMFHNFLQRKPKPISMLYLTPLRSLNRDMLRRLRFFCKRLEINIAVRHGDTSRKERRRQALHPPDLLISTPETLQLLLIGKRLREHLKGVEVVVVDEVHELAGTERGAQLSIALERLESLAPRFQRIGLSATVGDAKEVGKFLVGVGREVHVLKVSVAERLGIEVETPKKRFKKELLSRTKLDPSLISTILRCRELVEQHRSTLLFVNTRDCAEMLASGFKLLDSSFPVENHHGSLSKGVRTNVEDEFKAERLKGLICTSSLELGIDVGSADFVIQYNSPREVKRLVQRIGRSGHRAHETSNGRITCNSADEIGEASVIARRALKAQIEPVELRKNPLAVLANQLVAFSLSSKENKMGDVFHTIQKAYPFRELEKEKFYAVIEQLNRQGILWVNQDRFSKRKRALDYFYTNISMIPDERRCKVFDLSARRIVASLDESFADICLSEGKEFIVKGSSWQIIGKEEDKVTVAPTNKVGVIPAWVGEQIPVPFEVAQEVGRLRRTLELDKYPMDEEANRVFTEYVKQQSIVPNDRLITIEGGGELIIINACFGSRVNETIGALLSNLLAAKFGTSVAVQTDAYRIILEAPLKIDPRLIQKYLTETNPAGIKDLLRVALRNSAYFRHQLLHTAKKFGLISKDAEVSARWIISFARGSIVEEEALNKVLYERMDLPRAQRVLRELQKGRREIRLTKPSPIGIASLRERKRLVSPERAGREILKALKKRLSDNVMFLICLSCKTSRRVRVKEYHRARCYNCEGVLLAPLRVYERELAEKFRQDKCSDKELKKLKKSANLLLYHGKAALLALAARGVGVETGARILVKDYLTEDEFLRELLGAEVTYARTKRFW